MELTAAIKDGVKLSIQQQFGLDCDLTKDSEGIIKATFSTLDGSGIKRSCYWVFPVKSFAIAVVRLAKYFPVIVEMHQNKKKIDDVLKATIEKQEAWYQSRQLEWCEL